MLNNRKKAFTLTEMIVVITIIGVLMMGMTVYIGGSGEKTKTIEAQGCATSLGGQINNYIYYTLTSRTLNGISPDFYLIGLTGGTATSSNNCIKANAENSSKNSFCKDIVFSYIDGNGNLSTHQTINVGNTCRQAQPNLGFYRSGSTDVQYIKMNKGFSPISINEMKVFYLQGKNSNEKDLVGDIIMVLCSDDACTTRKQIGKWSIDGRSQTISLKKCRFYQENDSTRCNEREI